MNLFPTSSLPVARPSIPPSPVNFQRRRKLYIIASILAIGVVLALASLFSVYLGAKVAPGKKFRILGPATLKAGQIARISWDASPENTKKYPFEKIEYCFGKFLKPKCILLAAAAPNTGQAVVKVPASLPAGTGHLKFTARDPQRKLLGQFSATSGPVKVQPATTEVAESDGGGGGSGGGEDSGDGSGTNENQPTPTTPTNSLPQTAHIVNVTNKGLEYITNKSGTWQTTTIDPKGTQVGPRMPEKPVNDKEGNIHVVYSENFEHGPIKYGNNVNGQWNTEIVVPKKNEIQTTGHSKSIVLDDKGKAHISYVTYKENLTPQESEFAYLKYITNASGSWVAEIVDKFQGGGLAWNKNIINIDKNGKIHIIYFYPNCGNGICLKYATNISGSWTITRIDDNAVAAHGYESFDHLAAALDSRDKLHLAYHMHDTTIAKPVIKYASNNSGTWTINTLDSSLKVTTQQKLDLSLDSSDNPHLVYVSNITGNSVELKITSNIDGAWRTRALDPLYNFDIRWGSIALDFNEIVYVITHAGNYAANVTGQWITEKPGVIGFANLSANR